MSVELTICNSAIIKLGATPIQDLSDDTKEARLCRLQYPLIRDAALRSAPWSFAVARRVLTPITPRPAEVEFINGDEFVFSLPQNCVKVWKILDNSYVKYRQEGRYVIANDSSLYIYYVRNDVPPDFMDAQFIEATANLLAADLCYSITQSTSLKQGLESSAQFWISQARSYNSQEGTVENFQFDMFLDSRLGGRAVYE